MLLVDDDLAVRALFAISLNHHGCRTITAGNGEEALRILHTKPYVDVVITDVGMPVMDGLELLRRIRQSEGLTDLPVILCSGNDDTATMQKASEYGCARYLVKPVNTELLLEEVTVVLGLRLSV